MAHEKDFGRQARQQDVLFQMAGKALTESEKEQLAREYADDMDRRRATV